MNPVNRGLLKGKYPSMRDGNGTLLSLPHTEDAIQKGLGDIRAIRKTLKRACVKTTKGKAFTVTVVKHSSEYKRKITPSDSSVEHERGERGHKS